MKRGWNGFNLINFLCTCGSNETTLKIYEFVPALIDMNKEIEIGIFRVDMVMNVFTVVLIPLAVSEDKDFHRWLNIGGQTHSGLLSACKKLVEKRAPFAN